MTNKIESIPVTKPEKILVIGFGNPGRLDDGLGPVFAEQLLDELETHNIDGVTVDSNYQLNVEDAMEIAAHDVVVFVDAALAGSEPFFFSRLIPQAAFGFSTHTIEPEAVLQLAHTSFKSETLGFALGIRGYDFNEFLIGLSDHFRNFMVAKSTGKTDELNVSDDSAQKYLTEIDDFEIEDLLRLIKIASDTEYLIRKSSNARLHLEVAMIKMIKMTTSVQLSDILAQFEDAKKKNSVATTPPIPSQLPSPQASSPQMPSPVENNQPTPATVQNMPTPRREFAPSVKPTVNPEPNKIENNPPPIAEDKKEVAPSSDTPAITLDEVEKKWLTVIDRVKSKKIALGSLLIEGWPTRVEGVNLELAFDRKNGFHITSVERQASVIEEVIEEVFGSRLKLSCVRTDKEKLARVRKMPARVDKKQEFAKLEQEDDIVKEIVDKFDAEFIK